MASDLDVDRAVLGLGHVAAVGGSAVAGDDVLQIALHGVERGVEGRLTLAAGLTETVEAGLQLGAAALAGVNGWRGVIPSR